MKTIIEDRYLHSLDEASPLEGDLPKPTQNDPLGKKEIPTTQNTSKTEVDKSTEKETLETTKETKPKTDSSSPVQKKEVEITHKTEPDIESEESEESEESDTGLSNTVTDILKIYELKKIHEKVYNLKNIISKFSSVELDDIKSDIEESLYLFRKILIPNLDNLQFKLDDIIKGYQGLIKDVIFKLKAHNASQKRKQENEIKRRKK